MSVDFADLATIIACAMLIWWYAATAGITQTGIESSSAELAYLRSGAVLALLSSLAWLRAAGAASNAWDRQIVATGPAPAGADPLTQAVHSSSCGSGRPAPGRRGEPTWSGPHPHSGHTAATSFLLTATSTRIDLVIGC
ncbi:hypothetical protein HC031_19745 [Planosporangium thailandense]|uniref:Uncharacterized protein n=1 Tax=Planosporangium thailandense TaxID=765197 RepID=A0ABX0Y1B2_9ACTN|nr:hypothetical protein [Planosporangium thailandense]NJC71932.1 hypothetical protein [Planosporangium thailandense]